MLLHVGKKHPIALDILECRRAARQEGTYADPISRFIRSDGRVHPRIKIGGAATGRPSCEDPNVFNIPKVDPKKPTTKMARDCYGVANPDDTEILECDASQVEVRVACAASGDPVMLASFLAGEDFHLATARKLARLAWNMDPAAVGKKERDKSKTLNFAVMYGMGATTLAATLGITIQEAERLIRSLFGAYPQLAQYIQQALRDVTRDGQVSTEFWGSPFRTRPLWGIGSDDSGIKGNAVRASFNCLDDQTEALTFRGWVKGFDLQMDDVLLTKNPTTGALEWQGLDDLKKFEDYEGPLHIWRTKTFSAVSTAEHRWLVRDGNTRGHVQA